jgi:molecular chaperone HtpG
VAAPGRPNANLERLLRALDGNAEESPRILELNPQHPIVRNLDTLVKRDESSPRIATFSELLFDQALLAEGVLKDPVQLVRRIQELLTEVTSAEIARGPSETGGRGAQ